MIPFIWNIYRGKSTDTKADWWLPRAGKCGGEEVGRGGVRSMFGKG